MIMQEFNLTKLLLPKMLAGGNYTTPLKTSLVSVKEGPSYSEIKIAGFLPSQPVQGTV